MADDQAPQPSTFMGALTGIAGDVFEEAKILFYLTILATFIALWLFHRMDEMEYYSSTMALMWAGFGALVAKLAWGK